jgi:hypothetical protein
MFGWIRPFIDDLRFKQALLKGKRCPECHSADVGWKGKPRFRRCHNCGFHWEHRGTSWTLGPDGHGLY